MIVNLTAGLQRFWHQKSIRRTLQIAWVSLVVLFIALAIASSWEAVQRIEWTMERLGFVALSLIATLLRRLAGGLRWAWIIRLFGRDKSITIRQSLKVYFVANLATYLPGTYWFIPGRVLMNSKHGVGALQTGVSTLLEHFLLILSGALLGILGLDLIAELLGVSVNAFLWVILVIAVGLAAIHPWSIHKITNLMARALKMQPVTIHLSYGMTLLLLVWSILIWLLGSASLLFLAHAFLPHTGMEQLGLFSAVFAVSWLIGFFTPFAPSGLGVREGVMGLAFAGMGIPTGVTVLLATLSRLLIIFEDLFWAVIGFLL